MRRIVSQQMRERFRELWRRLPKGSRPRIFALLAILSYPGVAPHALDAMHLNVGDVQAGGLRLTGVRIDWQVPDVQRSPMTVRIEAAAFGDSGVKARALVIECANPQLAGPSYACADATVQGNFPVVGLQHFHARVSWNIDISRLQVSFRDVRLSGGRSTLQFDASPRGWNATVVASALDLTRLTRLASTLSGWKMPADLSVAGSLSFEAHAHGASIQPLSLQGWDAQASLRAASAANSDGSIAAEHLEAEAIIAAQSHASEAWTCALSLGLHGGEALSGRYYWNFSAQPAEAAAQLTADVRNVWLHALRLKLGQTLNAFVSADTDRKNPAGPAHMRVSIENFDLQAFPSATRDGLFAGSAISKLQGRGDVNGEIDLANGAVSALDLRLHDVELRDEVAQLGVTGLNGQVRWSAIAGEARENLLAWSGGSLYGLPFGASELRARARPDGATVTHAVRIPVLDGALRIETLAANSAGGPMRVDFGGQLEPISMPRLCKAFGWPEFAGTLAGSIPAATYEGGVLRVGGTLRASVFNGRVNVGALRLSAPFSERPQLQADLDFDALDLEQVTHAFSVGRITGRLSGAARGIELVRWQPVAFDAEIHSTLGDRSRRRISQRAVENISSLGGGGAGAALQRGMLRMFQDFNYERLGMSCKLVNDVCHVGGVGAAPGSGFYLVKGRGIPRIDVIGQAARIDWPRFVASLRELSRSQAAVGTPP